MLLKFIVAFILELILLGRYGFHVVYYTQSTIIPSLFILKIRMEFQNFVYFSAKQIRIQ